MSKFFVTVGKGIYETRGSLLEVDDLALVLNNTGPMERERWWAPHRWTDNRRSAARWEASCAVLVDLDFRDAQGEKLLVDPYGDDIHHLWERGDISGSALYLSRCGVRVVFLLDAATSDKDAYRDAVEAVHQVVAEQVRSVCPGAVVEADTTAMKDFARISWMPKTVDEKGGKRDAKVLWHEDEETGAAITFKLGELVAMAPKKPAPVAVAAAAAKQPKREQAATPAPAKGGPVDGQPFAEFDKARAAFLASTPLEEVWKGYDPSVKSCPFCGHKGCFIPMMQGERPIPGCFICRSTDHKKSAKRLGNDAHGLACKSADGAWWKIDLLDIGCWATGTPPRDYLVNRGWLQAAPAPQPVEEDGRKRVRTPRPEPEYVGTLDFCKATLPEIPPLTIWRFAGVLGVLRRDSEGITRHEPLDAEQLGQLASRHVQFVDVVWDKQAKAYTERRTNLSKGDMLALIGYARAAEGVPEIKAVVGYPAVAGDYEPLTPGWNEWPQLWYDEPADMRDLKPVTMSPAERREWLLTYFGDFLEVMTMANVANAVGLIVTAFIRPALVGQPIPMHVALSTMEGSGKTVLCDYFVGLAVTGRSASKMVLTYDLAENAKTLYSYAASGATCINIDNVRGGTTVDNELLASTLTSPTISARVLGTSTMREQPNFFVPMMTGNNISFSSEMARRVVVIEFTPRSSIYDRTFSHDALAWVRKNRRGLAEVIHGAIAEWKENGRKPHSSGRTAKGFDQWSRSVGGIVEACGFGEWLEGLQEWQRSDDANPILAAMRGFCEAWWGSGKPKMGSGVKELWELIEDDPSALGIQAGSVDKMKQSFGWRLKEMCKRPDLAPYRITSVGRKNHATQYAIERLTQQEVPFGAPGPGI